MERPKTAELTTDELLLRHQLNVAHYWQSRTGSGPDSAAAEPAAVQAPAVPQEWNLLQGVSLHEWQIECLAKWFAAGRRGVVKVVTGAGKTILALAIAQELQNKQESELRVAIIVPTIVLMGQWYDALLKHGNLPPSAIGRLGGGFGDDFSGDRRILIAVLASAAKLLAERTHAAQVGDSLLLIVDECHRAGAEKMSQVFAAPRAYSLGLSATPEREDIPETIDEDAAVIDAEEESFADTIIGQELGPIIYELTFALAISRGILPKFEIHHYGLPLLAPERLRYEQHSREITELRKALQQSSRSAMILNGGALVGWARKVAARPQSSMAEAAGEYVRQTTQRKQLLYHARAREQAVLKILARELADHPGGRAILFHESVTEVMRLFQLLRAHGFAVVPENYRLTDGLRADGIELFRQGIARVLVSARSLIEGFDVPAADIGIVVASSSSVRQRIQTLGRILRKYQGPDKNPKEAVLHVLYMAHTVDEMIYEKTDWEMVIGAERNLYFLWDPDTMAEPVPQDGPPRHPLPTESQIDWTQLHPGDPYPGRYEGEEYTCDFRGNVLNQRQRYVQNPQGIEDMLKDTKNAMGKFRVTPRKNAVLVRVFEDGSWNTRLAGFLNQPFEFRETSVNPSDDLVDISPLQPGDPYPGDPGQGEEYRLKKRAQGAVIAKRLKGAEVYARGVERAKDSGKGADADRIIDSVKRAAGSEGNWISKFFINHHNHAIYFSQGKPHFLCKVDNGLEFPENI